MKQITGIKVHAETSEVLGNKKKEWGLKTKEAVILHSFENNNLRINSEKILIPPNKMQDKLDSESLEEPETSRKFSIVEDILKKSNIKFIDKDNTIKPLIKPSSSEEVLPDFQKPYIIVERFQSQENKPPNTQNIEYEKIKELGFGIAILGTKYFRSWYRGQKVKYLLYHQSNPILYSRVINYIPKACSVQYDKNNSKIRIRGMQTNPNGSGSWMSINGGHS